MPYPERRASVNDIQPSPESDTEQLATAGYSALRQALIDTFQVVLQTLLLFLVLSSLIGRFEIHQMSMNPTFHEGQRVIVSQVTNLLPDSFGRIALAGSDQNSASLGLKHGQIVVFYATPEREGDPLIKRVIGVPGDTIAISDGQVYVNGEWLAEPYVHGKFTDCSSYCGPLTLGPGEYFMMGDNRPVSRDSRSFGPIPAEQIIGRVIMRFWPLDTFAFFE